MKHGRACVLACALALAASGCAFIPAQTNLKQVAADTGLSNITTGDGTFENYVATGHVTGTEVGIAIGIPLVGKLIELYPFQSNEGLLARVAGAAKQDGAEAMINVTPHRELYTGLPFIFVGIYVDQAEGTGIDVK